jgi:hypothetical protein
MYFTLYNILLALAVLACARIYRWDAAFVLLVCLLLWP